jgi:hypothetical protein
VGLPVGKGVLIAEDGPTVSADGKVAFRAALVEGGDNGVEFFTAIGADDRGLGPVKDVSAVEADRLGIGIGWTRNIGKEVKVEGLGEAGAAPWAHAGVLVGGGLALL